ncbi:MAG: hypothetical protein PF690_10685 [Deltaproteobacteria bacterium]|jgi:hypothetical protein|nr:hypothetical protein [Deltaproteobacteria bacterium]
MNSHTKYFKIGGFTIEVNSELPFKSDTFHPKIKQFEIDNPEKINIVINHHFKDKISAHGLIKDRIYYKKPLAIFKNKDSLIYEWINDYSPYRACHRKIITNIEHTKFDTYNDRQLTNSFLQGQLTEISLLPTDQIFLCRALAYSRNQGCIMHSMGLIHNNNGYLFLGHSEAGKSTMARIMKDYSTILCDDRNIIRKYNKNYILSGTWRHSDFTEISSSSAKLKAIFFLNQSATNQIERITDNKICFKKLLSCLTKSVTTDAWWDLSIDFLDTLSRSVECWDLKFDKSGKIREHITNLYN